MSANIKVMNRGDTFIFKVMPVDINRNEYMLQDEDAVYFGLMDPHQMFEDALVKKKYTKADINKDGSITITLKAMDTLYLYPGIYFYSIKLHRLSKLTGIDEVITIVNKTKFIIND